MSTIFALSTPAGRSGIAVVRVSGPDAVTGLKLLAKKDLKPRQATLCTLKDPSSRTTIDQAVVVVFKGPASFTGEDVVEYYVHGGRAVVQSLLSALSNLEQHRMAEPGEFTRRAFENGRLDLTEAEAVADLIDAETDIQKAQALAQMEGALSRLYNDWTERLKKALAHLEADIEFPDEDLPQGISAELMPIVKKIEHEISNHLQDNRRGERLRDGIHIAVIGAPNAGKSSLVNVLAQRDVAIVADLPGTTRDIIEAHLDIGGYPVILSDTAGLRPSQLQDSGHDKIESEGIRRALNRAKEADIKILLFDGSEAQFDDATLTLIDEKSIVAVNKIDQHSGKRDVDKIYLSVQTGEGIAHLLEKLAAKISDLFRPSETPSLTRQRHRNALEEAKECLIRAQNATLPELAAEDLRLAVRAIGRITGKIDVEDLLDVIFRDFCIGK